MKKKPKKEGIIFIITALLSAILIWCTTLIDTQKTFPYKDEERNCILFLGDSNMAYDFDGENIPQIIGREMDVAIFNCAVGGTTATKLPTADYFDTQMDLFCLYNMTRIMENGDDESVRDFQGNTVITVHNAIVKAEILSEIELDELDYVVIAYGINDYTTGRPIYCDDKYDEKTYAGALRSSVERIQKVCPNAKIILSSITYCAFSGGEGEPQDGYTKSWGGGTLGEYRDAMKLIASEYENVYFMDNLDKMGITYENYTQYMCDELHLNAEGQKLYTEYFLSFMEEIESN